MNEDQMEERILAYLLGECTDDEAFEVERLCREDSVWQSEKIRFGQVISLLDESMSLPVENMLSKEEAKLSDLQRNEIHSLLEEHSEKEQNLNVKDKMVKQKQADDKKSKIIFLAPLAAAAVAVVVAYWGNPEPSNNQESIESVALASDNAEKKLKDSSDDKVSDLGSAKLNQTGDSPLKTEGAVQESLVTGGNGTINGTLALRTDDPIKNASFGDSIEKELAFKSSETASSTDKNSTDEMLASRENIETKSAESLAAAFALPAPASVPSQSEIILEASSSSDLTLPARKVSPGIIDQNNTALGFGISDSKVADRDSSWFSNLKKSEESFIFNDKGDSLGKIQVTESFPGKFHFKRTDWPNKNINFILDPGSYEIRLSGKQLGTVILKGSLKKLDDDRKYEFEVSEAWKLGKDEKRTSIPIEILNP